MKIGKLKFDYFLSIVQERVKYFSLDDEELDKILTKRKKYLRPRERHNVIAPATVPLSEIFMKMIYSFSHNELRESFRICFTILKRGYKTVVKYGYLNDLEAYNLFYEFCESEVSDEEIDSQEKNTLSKIYLKGNVNNQDYSFFGYSSSQGFNSLLRSLENKNLIATTVRKSVKYYEPTWKLEALALCKMLNDGCTKKSFVNYTKYII